MAEQVYVFVYDSLSKAAARGVLAPADPHADTLALIAAVHGVIELHKSEVRWTAVTRKPPASGS